jgi:hypothetical protein
VTEAFVAHQPPPSPPPLHPDATCVLAPLHPALCLAQWLRGAPPRAPVCVLQCVPGCGPLLGAAPHRCPPPPSYVAARLSGAHLEGMAGAVAAGTWGLLLPDRPPGSPLTATSASAGAGTSADASAPTAQPSVPPAGGSDGDAGASVQAADSGGGVNGEAGVGAVPGGDAGSDLVAESPPAGGAAAAAAAVAAASAIGDGGAGGGDAEGPAAAAAQGVDWGLVAVGDVSLASGLDGDDSVVAAAAAFGGGGDGAGGGGSGDDSSLAGGSGGVEGEAALPTQEYVQLYDEASGACVCPRVLHTP